MNRKVLEPATIIQKNAAESIQAQVESFLLGRIDSDVWHVGSKIPSERDLALDLDVSRTTVRNAVLALTARGVFERSVGQGTFVKRKPGPVMGPRPATGTLGYVVCKEKTARKPIASEAFYTKFEALCDGIIDLKTQEEGGQINNYLRIRMLRGKTFDSRWHRIELSGNGEVRLAGTFPELEQRRLAAIMFTDIVGYTALSQKNEGLALELLEKNRSVLRSIFPRYHGREVKTIGDAFLVEFESALEAAKCAVEIQKTLHETNTSASPEVKINLRIGIHMGDVIHRGNDVYGDAVNIASRIEPLAPPGGICVSEQIFDHIRNKVEFPLSSTGKHELKNVDLPIEVYNIGLPWRDSRSPYV